MMNKNDWTNELRERLAEHQEPVSHDLWANIEQSITPVHKARIISFKRMSIAAAITALMIGGTYIYMSSSDKEGIMMNKLSSQQLVSAVDKPKAITEKEIDAVAEQLKTSIISKTSFKKSKESENAKTIAALQNTDMQQVSDVLPVSDTQEEVPQRQQEYPKQQKTSAKTSVRPSSSIRRQEEVFIKHSRSSHATMGMRLYAANGIVGKNNVTPSSNNILMDSPALFVFNENFLMMNAAPQKEQDLYNESHHNRPVSVGLQLDIPLDRRWSITTGVVYTNTYSEFVHNSKKSVKSQSLHYAGIPISLNYQFWGTKHLKTYVSAGGEGDYNVKNVTKYEDTKIDAKRDRIQWSANAAVGVQYDILPQVGVYVEPGVKYYFNNGSTIDNTFKDKPYNFNFQFGIRFNLAGE